MIFIRSNIFFSRSILWEHRIRNELSELIVIEIKAELDKRTAKHILNNGERANSKSKRTSAFRMKTPYITFRLCDFCAFFPSSSADSCNVPALSKVLSFFLFFSFSCFFFTFHKNQFKIYGGALNGLEWKALLKYDTWTHIAKCDCGQNKYIFAIWFCIFYILYFIFSLQFLWHAHAHSPCQIIQICTRNKYPFNRIFELNRNFVFFFFGVTYSIPRQDISIQVIFPIPSTDIVHCYRYYINHSHSTPIVMI